MYDLSETQQFIVDTAREIAQDKIKKVRAEYDKSEQFPWEIVEHMKKADLFGIYLPEKYGGLGGCGFDLVLAVEQLSIACGGIALSLAATALGAFPILLFGTPEQKQKWLPRLATGTIGAFAITEPESGSDATSMKCRAVLEGDHYVVNGVKSFCTNGEAAQIYSFFASTRPDRGARGISCFVVEKGTPGFGFGKKEEKMGIRASTTYELTFDNCKIPKENLIGMSGGGLFVAQATFDISRPGIGGQAIGIAQGAFDEMMKYIRMRRQFGQSILSFQSIQHAVADMATNIEAGRALLYAMTRAMDKTLLPAIANADKNGTVVDSEIRKISRKRWTKESAMVKLYCSEMAMKVTSDVVQICGGVGYMRDFPVEKYMRDAKITQIYEGASQLQRNEIGMALTKEYAK